MRPCLTMGATASRVSVRGLFLDAGSVGQKLETKRGSPLIHKPGDTARSIVEERPIRTLRVSSLLRLEFLALAQDAIVFFRVWIGPQDRTTVCPVPRLRMSANTYGIANHADSTNIILGPSQLCALTVCDSSQKRPVSRLLRALGQHHQVFPLNMPFGRCMAIASSPRQRCGAVTSFFRQRAETAMHAKGIPFALRQGTIRAASRPLCRPSGALCYSAMTSHSFRCGLRSDVPDGTWEPSSRLAPQGATQRRPPPWER